MNDASRPPVLLVVPPFQTVGTPALGVSQLKANLEHAGHPTTVLYLNLLFAETIGVKAYEWISERTIEVLLGEYVFSRVLFPQTGRGIDDYVDDILAPSDLGADIRALFDRDDLNGLVGEWVDAARTFVGGAGLDAILAARPWLVGFTSSFQQNCAALALIEALKQARPDVVTVLGGANTQTEMGEELFARFDGVDHVGQAECDHSLVALVDSLAAARRPLAIPGILSRDCAEPGVPSVPLTGQQLDALPHPDFHDYFEQFARAGFADEITHSLVMETSRGCWWGAKHHCTFCGLNGEGMGFRSKSPTRALEEIDALVDEYRVPRIAVADNILDMKYFRDVLPALAEEPKAGLFYEIKANLTREQVSLLARSQVRWIQPGIESYSDNTLRLMRKGCSMLQNVQLLKWCAEDGIFVGWNYLYGFPGEDSNEAVALGEHIEATHHLQPPTGTNLVRIDRFSPYYNDAAGFGLTGVRPFAVYAYVYPFPEDSLQRLAYFFDCDHADEKRDSPDFRTIESTIARWEKHHRYARLVAIPRRGALLVIDTRGCRTRLLHRLTGLSREILEHCESIHGSQEVIRFFAGRVGEREVTDTLDALVDARLMLRSGDRYLSLTMRLGRPLAPFAPRRRPGRRTRWRHLAAEAVAVVTFEVSPWQALGTLGKRAAIKAGAMRLRAFNRLLAGLVTVLSEAPRETPSAGQKAALQR